MTRVLIILLVVGSVGGLAMAERETPSQVATYTLPASQASGVRLDTLLIGGYASGRFATAVQQLSSDLSEEERVLLGEHLDRIFGNRFGENGLERPGRLRIAYERASRPDGTTRSIRVLGAEVGAGGRLHTVYHFDADGRTGYFDSAGGSVNGEGWTSPVPRLRVNSPFGRARMHPILNRVLPHTGVDLAASRGEPVRAPADGIVAAAGRNGGYGLLVELQHPNGYGTRYAHLDRIAAGISPREIVRKGDILGYVGSSGLATGPHLHYEVRRRGQPIDPLSLAARSSLGNGVLSSPSWPAERRRLTELLSRTPTVIERMTASASAD